LADEAALLHLINLCAERGETVLLIGREAPARWQISLPDLVSRLRATQAVGLGPASDALLRGLLSKFLADRQLRLDAEMQSWLLMRLPRDAASLAEAVARLDHAALGFGGRITRPLARIALAEDRRAHPLAFPGTSAIALRHERHHARYRSLPAGGKPGTL